MVKFENTRVYNIDRALHGMRNPLQSWDRSDSLVDGSESFLMGQGDKLLTHRLIVSGSEHRKFMRQIFVCVDITAPRFWFQELDTYKIGTVSNSTSTMHTLAKKEITRDMFYFDGVDEEYIDFVLNKLNLQREKYNESHSLVDFTALKSMLPESFLNTRMWSGSYENLYIMFRQRKNHKLSGWSVDFVDWVKTLPYAEELLLFGVDENAG